MQLFTDVTIVAAAINFINTVTNLYWTVKLKSIQGNATIMSNLRESNAEKDQVIKDLMRKKNQYKIQYTSLLTKYKRLEGQLQTYESLSDRQNSIIAEPQNTVAKVQN